VREAVISHTTIERARDSRGSSGSPALLALVRSLVEGCPKGVLLDVGCGSGQMYSALQGSFHQYIGVDVVKYDGFPAAPDASFIVLDLDRPDAGLPQAVADVVCCVETIEHLENPRALARQLDRLARPGAQIVITTPNQLSLLSKACLVFRNEFVHFQERPGLYPAHLTALLECDLRRIATEIGWEHSIWYSGEGRIPGTSHGWPGWLTGRSGWRGRSFSDNVVLSAFKPLDAHQS
jgi:SAM-dependent methyltransferase